MAVVALASDVLGCEAHPNRATTQKLKAIRGFRKRKGFDIVLCSACCHFMIYENLFYLKDNDVFKAHTQG
jgi:hypothetical protein